MRYLQSLVAGALYLLIVAMRTLGDPRNTEVARLCNSTQDMDPMRLAENCRRIMDSLNDQIADKGFGSAVSGNESWKLYGLAQCMGDLSETDCRLCFASSRLSIPSCHPSVEGRVYMDGCFLRYAEHDFFNETMDFMDPKICNYSTNISDEMGFLQAIGNLTRNIAVDAVKNGGFKVGSISLSRYTVYGLGQCWNSLDMELCRDCLVKASSSVLSCAPASEARALNTGCYMRYSLTKFYNDPSASYKGNKSKLRIVLSATLPSLFLVLGLVFGFFIHRSRFLEAKRDRSKLPELPETFFNSKLNFKYETLRQATGSFRLSRKLGEGGFGSVYKGTFPDGREIAVKRLLVNRTQSMKEFFNEVNVVSRVQHPNLVRLLGCSIECSESLLVYEYLPNKSLDLYLFDSDKCMELDWDKRYKIMLGAAEGLAYLHEECEVRIIHRDIKASNILLDHKLRPKIADFGLARFFGVDRTHLDTGIAGTMGYIAPEYAIHGQLTEKADVYSFGVLLLELLSGKRNNEAHNSENCDTLLNMMWNQYEKNEALEILDPVLESNCSKEEVSWALQVGLLCIQESPSLRPTMSMVVQFLKRKVPQLPQPSPPPFFYFSVMESGQAKEAPGGVQSDQYFSSTTSLSSSFGPR
ncbi:cysteine-rich receptor-like protein kinase 2 [Amborella trichopoda]|uniref:cysteine-rich receptor-like protein kinase 2 n=1 Tax=Amborella trichopoda TaxID=13333 RepID=UPI0005D34C0C|nr:cysteine-rich receptor-like protein kinase 2 [Amborella trichopoda]|eukprot:XP_011622120.1 cysteine-rich receptor-like protein kinase 2 [Amborella trichopoda]